MRRYDSDTVLAISFVALLSLLLTVLASLQYRWIGQVSQAERERLQAGVDTAAQRFAADFDLEITRTFAHFQTEPFAVPLHGEDLYGTKFESWLDTAPYPGLVSGLFLISIESGSPRLSRLDPVEFRFLSASWSDDLISIRRRLIEGEPGRRRGPGTSGVPLVVTDRMAALVVPSRRGNPPMGRGGRPPRPARPDRGDPSGRFERPERSERSERPEQILLVILDLTFIEDVLLPELAERYFLGGQGLDYDLEVANRRSGAVIFESDPSLPSNHFAQPDAAAELFALRVFPELRLTDSFFPPTSRPGPPDSSPERQLEPPSASPRPSRNRTVFPGFWELLVVHRRGSLEAVVAKARNRNLALSLATLGLLAGTTASLFGAARRARRLARQQLEFVAGLTHELHTPLAALRAAGENLADGVVTDADQVRRYGALVKEEGGRLSDLVAQALELAGIQSGARSRQPRPVVVSEILGEAIDDAQELLDRRSIRIERDDADSMPAVAGDPAALRRLVHNLLSNAVKYGPAGSVVRLGTRTVDQGGKEWLEIRVEDRGPGIPKDEQSRIFEPFFRGRVAVDEQIPGNGIGLSVVRHLAAEHGGTARVESATGGGAAFIVRLPANRNPAPGSRVGVPVSPASPTSSSPPPPGSPADADGSE